MKNLIEFIKIRAKLSGRQLLSFDELAGFPAEQLKELEGKGYIDQIEDADGIICTECDDPCRKPVETRLKNGKPIGVIYCEDKDCGGLIPVEFERLQRWEIVKEKLFKKEMKKTGGNTVRPEYIFKRNGDMWEVTYKGKPTNIKHRNGMLYIEHLLRNPKREFRPLELKQIIEPPETVIPLGDESPGNEDDSAKKEGGMSPVEANAVADNEALRAYYNRLTEIDVELEEAICNKDQAKEDELLSEKDAILQQVRGSTVIQGQFRQFSGNETKVKDAISTAIRRAINSIKEHHEELSVHLDSNVSRGNPFSYSSEPEIDWHFE